MPPKSDEPGSDECAAPVAKRCRASDTEYDLGEFPIPAAHSDQVVAASGQKEVKPRRIGVIGHRRHRRGACCSSRTSGSC